MSVTGAQETPVARQAFQHFRRLLSGELVNKVARFAAAAFLARTLGTSDFGVFNIAIAVSGCLVAILSMGLSEYGTRELARTPEDAAWLAGRVLSLRALVGYVVLIPATIVASVTWSEHFEIVLATSAMTIAMLLSGEWFARGMERMFHVAVVTSSGGLIALSGALYVYSIDGSVAQALGVFAAAEAIVSILYWKVAPRWFDLSFGLSDTRPMVRAGLPIAASTLAVYALYANLDTVILGATRSSEEAGIYSASYRMFLGANIVAIFAAYALYPSTSRHGDANPAELMRRLQPTAQLLLLYGVALLCGAILAGGDFLAILFGEDYREGHVTLILLATTSAWYCVAYPLGYNLIAQGSSHRFTTGAVSAALLSVALNAALIPTVGMTGAASATLASVAVGSVLWMRPWELDAGDIGRYTTIVLIGVTVTGVAAAAAPDLRIALGVLLLALSGVILQRATR